MSGSVVLLSPSDLVKLVREAVAAELDARALKPPTEWLSLKRTGLPVTTIRKLVKTGEIRGCVVGRESFVSSDDLQKYLERRAAEPTDTRVSVEDVEDAPEEAFEAARRRGRMRQGRAA